jgi:hypothetical protein
MYMLLVVVLLTQTLGSQRPGTSEALCWSSIHLCNLIQPSALLLQACAPQLINVICPTVFANSAGFAAEAGDEAKELHHQNQLVVGNRLVLMVQESYGRMGRQAAAFVKQLAAHSSTCEGGSASQILRRRAVIHASLRTQLSTVLAREVSERVLAYIRGARRLYGRMVDPVSALLL